jgi:dGTPase
LPIDNRSPFERDRDRIIYTSAYRRLAGVTQVVSALEGHVFHNRLTHTIKVAQVTQRLSQRLLRESGAQRAADDTLPPVPLDADAAEAAAHAHDIGHPPFGHVAEEELQRLMTETCGSDTFEGNAQSFRIVTQVASARTKYPGLDLTRATLDGILKYPWYQAAAPEEALRKWGAYRSEEGDFEFARAGHEAGSHEKSLEAAIMDWADDITYAVHDVEDLYRAGLIPADRLRAFPGERDEFGAWVATRWNDKGKRDVRQDEIGAALNRVWSLFSLTEPYDGGVEQRAKLRTFTSVMIKQYVQRTSLVHEGGDWRLGISPAARLEVDVLKELTWRYVIERAALASQQHGQKKVITDLFCAFLAAADPDDSLTPPSLLPLRTVQALDALSKQGTSTDYSRARVVCDAVCSMTEDEALRLQARLSGQSLGSVLDSIV